MLSISHFCIVSNLPAIVVCFGTFHNLDTMVQCINFVLNFVFSYMINLDSELIFLFY